MCGGGHACMAGMHVWLQGMCALATMHGACMHRGRMQAGSTHPTGMLSFLN